MSELLEVKELITKGNEATHALRDAVESKADKSTVEAIKTDLAATIEAKSKLEAELKAKSAIADAHEKRIAELEMSGKSRPGHGNKAAITDGEKAFYEFMVNPEKKSAFEANALSMVERKSIDTAVGTNGGYAVPKEIAAAVLEIARNFSPIRRLSRVDTVATPEYSVLVNKGGATVRWGNQLTTRVGTTAPQLAEVKPVWGTMYTDFGATRQAIADMVRTNAVAPWAIREIAYAFAQGEGKEFLVGTGLDTSGGDEDKPIGLLNGTALERVNSGAAATLGDNVFDSVIKLFFSLKGEYAQNATFVMNSATLATLVLAKNDQGDYLFPQTLQAGIDGVILGRQVAIDENMPAIAAGSTPILFGDLSRAYLICDRESFYVQENPFRQSGRVYFEGEKRVGANIADENAAKLLRIAV